MVWYNEEKIDQKDKSKVCNLKRSAAIDRAKTEVDVIVRVVGVVRDSVVNRCFNMLNVFRNLEQSRRK